MSMIDIKLKKKETVAIAKVVEEKFQQLQELTHCLAGGAFRALVVQGDGGLGKTYEVEQVLEDYKESHNIVTVKGQITPLQLFNLLQENSTETSIVVFDDCDEVLRNVIALNLMKAATDTGRERWVNWQTSSTKIENPTFRFDGRIIVITNHGMAKSNHIKAFLDRVTDFRLDLTVQEKLVRICQIAKTDPKYDWTYAEPVLEWLIANAETLKANDNLSMRTFVKVYGLAANTANWVRLCENTVLKNRG
jgi:hypothetical protein